MPTSTAARCGRARVESIGTDNFARRATATERRRHPSHGAGNRTTCLRSAPFDARSADDRLFAGSEPHEGLVATVVVGGPEEERRVLAADAAGLVAEPLPVEPRADERIGAPFLADRCVFAVAGKDTRVRIECEQHVQDRVLELAEIPA